jgi:hypothetical protein
MMLTPANQLMVMGDDGHVMLTPANQLMVMGDDGHVMLTPAYLRLWRLWTK